MFSSIAFDHVQINVHVIIFLFIRRILVERHLKGKQLVTWEDRRMASIILSDSTEMRYLPDYLVRIHGITAEGHD